MQEATETEARQRDRHPLRAAIFFGLVLIAFGMFYSLYLEPRIQHLPAGSWWRNFDVWVPVQPARYVATGAYAFLYGANRLWVAGPLLPVLLAPAVAIGDRLGLMSSIPYLLPRPTMWLLYGPYALAFGVLPLVAVRRLAVSLRAASERTVARQPLAALQMWILLLALVPAAAIYGHYEDVIALGLMLLALDGVFRGKETSSAVLIGLAVGFKQWGLLGVPLLVPSIPHGRRLRWLVIALGVDVVIYGPLVFDWHHTYTVHAHPFVFPDRGHLALWFLGRVEPLTTNGLRLFTLPLAVLAGWYLAKRPTRAATLGGFALVFFARVLSEPVAYPYYLAVPLTFLLLHEDLRTGRPWRTVVLGTAMMLLFAWEPNPYLWWALELALAIAIMGPAARDFVRPTDLATGAAPLPATN